MNDYKLPPVRRDSEPMDASAFSQNTDWGLVEHRMPELWKRSQGKDMLVIVLDTGVPEHTDLPDPLFTANFTSDRSESDRNGHQTHCAGIVAAKNNEFGVVGWAPQATLPHIKVLGDYGVGRSDWVEKGIRYAIHRCRKVRDDFAGCIISKEISSPTTKKLHL